MSDARLWAEFAFVTAVVNGVFAIVTGNPGFGAFAVLFCAVGLLLAV